MTGRQGITSSPRVGVRDCKGNPYGWGSRPVAVAGVKPPSGILPHRTRRSPSRTSRRGSRRAEDEESRPLDSSYPPTLRVSLGCQVVLMPHLVDRPTSEGWYSLDHRCSLELAGTYWRSLSLPIDLEEAHDRAGPQSHPIPYAPRGASSLSSFLAPWSLLGSVILAP